MTDLILRLFVRDWRNTESPAVRERCGRVAGVVGIVTNFLLFAMKITVGTLFNRLDYGGRRQQPDGFRLLDCHARRL